MKQASISNNNDGAGHVIESELYEVEKANENWKLPIAKYNWIYKYVFLQISLIKDGTGIAGF